MRRVRLPYKRTEARKRKLLGPELVSRLKGKAWEVSVEVDRDQLRKSTGPRYLLRFLEERLLKSPINDLGLRLEDKFAKLRRQHGTGMSQLASQVRECYRLLKRSLGKLQATRAPLTEKNVKSWKRLRRDPRDSGPSLVVVSPNAVLRSQSLNKMLEVLDGALTLSSPRMVRLQMPSRLLELLPMKCLLQAGLLPCHGWCRVMVPTPP